MYMTPQWSPAAVNGCLSCAALIQRYIALNKLYHFVPGNYKTNCGLSVTVIKCNGNKWRCRELHVGVILMAIDGLITEHEQLCFDDKINA